MSRNDWRQEKGKYQRGSNHVAEEPRLIPLQLSGHQSWMNTHTQHALLSKSICEQAGEPHNSHFELHVICHELRENLRCSVWLKLHGTLLQLTLQD